MKPRIVLAGVTGSGKSTVGPLVAAQLGVPFADADALHPTANVAKMASGTPLTDADRQSWLRLVGRALAAAEPTGLVMACSALRRSYRGAILEAAPATRFVLLVVGADHLAERLEARHDHFMPASLLASQLETLEPLEAGEPGFEISADAAPAAIADSIVARLVAPAAGA